MPNFRQTSKGTRSTVRLPVLTDEHINLFSGASINDHSGLIYNGILDNYAGEKDRKYVTQRPSIKIFDDASASGAGEAGQGLYYWSANSTRYIVNNGVIYKGSYSVPLTVTSSGALTGTAMTAGTSKVYFVEYSTQYNDYLLIVNCADGEMFIIQATEVGGVGDDDPINVQDIIDDIGVSGTGTPFHASETWDFTGLEPVWDTTATGNGGQCCGVVVLDSYLFLGTKDGKIYNSNNDDFFTWDATLLNFITAERENDKLLYIDKSKDHLAAFGERSTELFYDAAVAAPASPLAARTDIYYNTGIISGQTGWRDGDDIYFVGMKPNGDFHMYTLINFQLEEDSTSTIDSFLRTSRTQADLVPKLSGFSSGNHVYAILTIFDTSNMPQISLVWDSYTKIWYEWAVGLLNLTHFPLLNWTIRTPEIPQTAEGIMSNGDLFFIADDFVPIDGTASEAYFAEDYASGDYSATSTAAAAVTANIIMRTLITNIEVDTTDRKFLHSLNYVGNRPSNSQILTVEWSDDEWDSTYSSNIDVNKRTQINRMGSFDRRRFRTTYSGDQQLRIEALEATYSQGTT